MRIPNSILDKFWNIMPLVIDEMKQNMQWQSNILSNGGGFLVFQAIHYISWQLSLRYCTVVSSITGLRNMHTRKVYSFSPTRGCLAARICSSDKEFCNTAAKLSPERLHYLSSEKAIFWKFVLLDMALVIFILLLSIKWIQTTCQHIVNWCIVAVKLNFP